MSDLDSPEPATKYAASRSLRKLSERSPEDLLPELERFVQMLSAKNSFLRWDATRIVGNLVAVSSDSTIDSLLGPLLAPIAGPQMAGAEAAMAAGTTVALANPQFADRIARAILDVRTARYRTAECRNIAIGHAIEHLGRFVQLLADQSKVNAFVTEQLDNPRNATRNKAVKFLRRTASLKSNRATAAGR